MKKIRAVISVTAFILLMGVIGGMENETICFSVGAFVSAVLLIAFAWGAKPWMR